MTDRRQDLADLAWLIGCWNGEKSGALIEETWSSNQSSSMLGMFRMVSPEKPIFYELMSLRSINDEIHLLLRHVDGEFNAWEDKDSPLRYRLNGSSTRHNLTFENLGSDGVRSITYCRMSAQELTIVLDRVDQYGVAAKTEFAFRRST